jgi:hypothetical protein
LVFQGGQILLFMGMRVRLTHALKISRILWKSKMRGQGAPRSKVTARSIKNRVRMAVGHFSSFRGNNGAISPMVWPD